MSEPLYKQSMLRDGALENKVAIITGGGTGLGKAMAMEFARLGSGIIIASRKMDVLEEAAHEISEFGVKVIPISMDIRNPEQVDRMMSQAVSEFGKVDVLVNNAAGNFPVDSLEMSDNAWNAVVGIVLNGTWYCSQRAGKQMVKQGTGGSILNVGASYMWTGGPKTVHSAAAKAGILAMTKSLAVEWAPHRIRVNEIVPGAIEDTGAVRMLWSDEDTAKKVLNNIPAGRFGTSQEVANLASYLVSDYAAFVSGACFVIDSGSCLNKSVF
ncbi:SDR family oxidoreductase [Peribacillus frigoritolerans]|uniref:SDR family oxidoreductase n=1 Tax=Peribacillus frigoritolerans TaxID=450367 RepID=UPI0020BD6B52|nr:SDR family oxidoreductase [Peribacillus frigoritolerans]MEE3954784.1 SDR family oxidoreductase [Peribacillus frigoritolerans]